MDDSIIIREMSIEDYVQVMELWSCTEGIGLSDADTKENISKFLERNVGLSFVAEDDGQQICGAILCGHDGRRGYLQHLAVSPVYRKKGIGSRLVANCFMKLKKESIWRCHIFVFENNQQGMNFWNHIGFYKNNNLNIFSKDVEIYK